MTYGTVHGTFNVCGISRVNGTIALVQIPLQHFDSRRPRIAAHADFVSQHVVEQPALVIGEISGRTAETGARRRSRADFSAVSCGVNRIKERAAGVEAPQIAQHLLVRRRVAPGADDAEEVVRLNNVG
jgi:hypothetical protein